MTEPLKLEVGKTYRNREGEIVTILFIRVHPTHRFMGNNGSTYREDGGFDEVEYGEHGFDLVEEIDLAAARHTNAALSCIMTAVEAAHG